MAKIKGPVRIEPFLFDDMHRGTSYTIPILMMKSDGTKFDLSNYTAIFTLKAAQFDHDYDDDRALITKEFRWDGDKEHINRIDIVLTSKELWLEPGVYFFDVVLMNGASSRRVLLAQTHIVGGPTNHNVRHDANQGDFFIHDPISITEDKSNWLIGQVPLLTDPPENLVETVQGDPEYILEKLDNPVRNIRYKVYGPRLSLMMTFKVAHDHTNHVVRFNEHFLRGDIPAPCPLKNGSMTFNNRKITLKLAKEMTMTWKNTAIQHNPEITYDGGCGQQVSSDPLYISDRTDAGHLYIHLNDNHDQICIDAHHFIPDDHYGFEMWMVRVDWFNWVDPYEPDPEDPDVSTHFPDGCPVADSQEDFWPPDMWYGADDKEYAKTKKRATKCSGAS